jgi:hypothetical protein
MKPLILIALIPALSGCLATFDGKMENRLTMTTACDEVRTDSLYGPVGISSKITAKDAAPVLAALCGARAAAPAAAASGAK